MWLYKLSELSEKVDQSVIRWYGHMEKMSEKGLVNRIHRAGVDGTRGRGRARTGLLNGVRKVLGERCMTIQQAERCM